MKLFQMPQLIGEDVPSEDRLRLLREIGNRAKAEFDEKYPRIQRWLTDYDPVHVLSMCARYFGSFPEGIDPEATGQLEFFSHYLEIMQAFALYQTRNLSPTPLHNDLAQLKNEMAEIGKHMSARLLSIPEALTTEDQINAHFLRTDMMADTTAVRGWAYAHQMRRVVLELAATVRADFVAKYDVDPVAFFAMIFALADERNDLLNAHISNQGTVLRKRHHREMMAAYNDVFGAGAPDSTTEADQLWETVGRNIKGLRNLILCHSDLNLEDVYSFSLDHVVSLIGNNANPESIGRLLDRLTYRFGDLANFDKDHIILGNPVLSRPFIKLDDERYFTAIWGILPHLAYDLLEDLVWEDTAIRSKYARAKSKYLEDELERIMCGAFPNATLFRGSLWTDPDSGKKYENDLLVVIGSFALVLEAKSASVGDPARRGAPDSLAETLRELIEEPSEQAHRFIQHLSIDPRTHTFKTRRGVSNVVDSTVIKHYIPLGVTLSHLGAIGSNVKKLIKAGITRKRLEKLAPSISVTDLEDIVEILPLEIEKVHYFARRREFEAHMNYEGDEMDLLALYLDTGFNIGATEYDTSVSLNLTMKSKELDPYFIGSREGKRVAKPRLSMTRWWRHILARISRTRLEGWVETGFILLSTTKEDQATFESHLKKLAGRVKRGDVKMPQNFVIWRSGPERRLYVIAGYPYTTPDTAVRNASIEGLIEKESGVGVRGIVVLGVSLTKPIYPYAVLARKAAINLFDTLTL